MQQRLSTIVLNKPYMKFAAGHFTIFSATQREALHGHNYTVSLAVTTRIDSDLGLNFDYRYYKQKMIGLCKQLAQTFLLPTKSPYLTFDEDENYLYAIFNGERIPFLRSDVTFLPITNITIEELSYWFIQQLIEDIATLEEHKVEKLCVEVYSSPGQSGSCEWEILGSNSGVK